MKRIIADTGVIVALIDKREEFHDWTSSHAKTLPVPFLTCETVISESCFLLHNVYNGEKTVLSYIRKRILQIDFSLSAEIEAVETLISKYNNVPMSLTDACLVRLSEIHNDAAVFTLDSDFHIYRKNGRQKISLIIPE